MGLTSCLIGLVLATLPEGIEGVSDLQVLERAERSFSEGLRARERPEEARPLFRLAGDRYRSLEQRGFQNPDLYRNQGNAYLLAGDLPRAILAYRSGLRLAPADRLLQAHLEYAREQVVFAGSGSLGRPPGDRRPPWLPWIAPLWRFLLGFAFYLIACVTLTRWWMVSKVWSLGAASGAVLVAIFAASSLVASQRAQQYEAHYPLAVIAEDGVVLQKGNGQTYPPRYEKALNRGIEARVLFTRGSWVQIELAGGEVGWVPADSILTDRPETLQ